MNVIEVKDLVRDFNGLRAVDGVSIDVREGEVFGFLGPNGAGKTTTISILCTLLRPTSGSATVAGFDVTRDPHAVRLSIGLVFQDPSLDERLTGKENMEFHAMLYNIGRKTRQERIDQVLKMVELEDRKDDLVRTYSGGMKRRLEIGRGLLHYPKVLFLDEPTLGLDPQTRSHIWNHIRELKEREKITIFMTTHYMDEAENCDRIAIIDSGKIIALDTPKNLKTRVGGDVLCLCTPEAEQAKREIREAFDLEAQIEDDGVHLEVKEAEKFIPRLLKGVDVQVDSITLRRPTLEDVFLKLTGKAIREEGAGRMEHMRSQARPWMRRAGGGHG